MLKPAPDPVDPDLAARRGPVSGWRRSMRPWLFPVAVYLSGRLVDAALIYAATRGQPAPEWVDNGRAEPPRATDPSYWEAASNWDGRWYRAIADHGYPVPVPVDEHGQVQRSEWAFYPAYPMAVRLVMAVTRLPFEIAAPALSTVFGLAAALLLYGMLRRTARPGVAKATVAAFSCFAAAPVLQVGYSDSMALVLVLTCLSLVRAGRWRWFAAAAILLALTRPVAAALGAALLAAAVVPWPGTPRPSRERAKRLAGAGLCTGSLSLLWPALAGLLSGRADVYFATSKAWTPGLGTLLPSLTTWWAYAGYVGVVLFVALVVVIVVVTWREPAAAWGLELRSWAFAYPLYLLSMTLVGPSHLRYLILGAVWAWPWPSLRPPASVVARRWQLVGVVALLASGLVAQWWWLNTFWRLNRGLPP